LDRGIQTARRRPDNEHHYFCPQFSPPFSSSSTASRAYKTGAWPREALPFRFLRPAPLPAGHHVQWDEFCTTFHAHHLCAGLLCTKLKEFLDFEQGNHSVFDYTK
jgi:hypothetical protein